MEKPFFTIFTPVFNGEAHLHRVFESVTKQIFRDFEWIICNDGSVDNTAALVKSFIQDHPEIDIIYLEQENSGKHISWNRAVKIASGKLFVPADADDSFMPDTLSFFYERWNALTPAQQLSYSGINVVCFDNDTDNIVGTPFPIDGMITNNLELEYKYDLKGEKWGCIRVDLLKSRPFPIIKGSHYPEGYIWLYLAKKYKVICFNKALRRYYTTDTGISRTQAKKVNNPTQNKINLKITIWLISNFGIYMMIHSPKRFIRNIYFIMKLCLIILIRR